MELWTIACLLAVGLVSLPGTEGNGICYGSTAVTLSNACSSQQSYTTTSYYYTSCGWWGWRRCRRSSTSTHYYTSYSTCYNTGYQQNSYCCSGYSGSPPNCYAQCPGGCVHGSCVTPNNCNCNSGYSGSDCNTPLCATPCQNGGVCSAPNTCSCASGWSGSYCQNPVCSSGCGNGFCSSPGTCSCNAGWTGSTCNNNINECASSNGGCVGTCHDTQGSYYCTCPSGCTLASNGHGCNDINECSAGTDNCAHNCHNNGNCGGFYCSCNTGYSLSSNGHSCNDINECASNNGGCAHQCHNTVGSYYCTCNAGYSLHSNGHACNDINECSLGTSGCNQICTNTIGSYECSCNIGYELSSNQRTCVDTNECAINNGGCDQNCHNTVGSYFCTCNTGYTLNSNGHTCDDVNECTEDTHLCHHICINNIGSYTCDCNVGYMLNSDGLTCSDINECNTDNGGCDQVCHNTDGSYYCTCNTGFLLDEDNHGCSDHDECATDHDNCDQNCHNTHGSFYCTCNNGWRLDGNGYTCNDINECDEDISGCTQKCHNTLGSYYCSCYIGFSLDADSHTCNDINECDTNNGGCGHICKNSIGSYMCYCRPGYDLASDFHRCDAQPCDPQLTAPQNGTMECTGDQVTDQNCSFACDPGFTFHGSELRECQSDNSWTGVAPYCVAKHCVFLADVPNGHVLRDVENDCGTVLTTACEIRCVEGYYINDTIPYYQTCVANQTTGDVYWTTPPVCELIPPCDPNPCQHSGQCTEVSDTEYICDCTGTNYKGHKCDIGIITFPSIPILTVNETTDYLKLFAYPTESITITFVASPTLKFSPPNVTIVNGYPEATIIINPGASGKFPLTYTITGPNAAEFEQPSAYIVLVLEPDSTHPKNKYFKEIGNPPGIISPGCCTPSGVNFQCPSSPSAVSFSSSCSWSTGSSGNHLSNGVVFASGPGINLPLSIAGSEVSVSTDAVQNTLPFDQLPCNDCGGTGSSCYHYDFTTNDVADFLQTQSLGNTFLNNTQPLFPVWLNFELDNTSLPLATQFTSSDYSTTLSTGSNIGLIPHCEGLTVEQDGLFSVLQLNHNVTVNVDSLGSTYVPADSNVPICFAVDLCNGSSSPVHITIPPNSQETIKSLDQFQQYTKKDWQFTFSEALVSKLGVTPPYKIPNKYFNGNNKFDPSIPKFDLRLETTIAKQLLSDDLGLKFDFDGDMYHQAAPMGLQVEGILAGDISLKANLTMNNEQALLRMTASKNKPAVFSMPGFHTTDIPGGASFKLQYVPDPDDEFFSRILPLPESKGDCDLDAFVKFNSSTLDLSWMSLSTTCQELRVANYMINRGSTEHFVYLTGESDPPTPENRWKDAKVKIFSRVDPSPLQLNQYMSIRQPSSLPAISAGYWENGREEGVINEAELSLLGTYFTTSAAINEESLTFATNASIFNRYPCDLSVRVPSGYSWDEVPFNVAGVLEDGEDSFQRSLENYTHNSVMSKIDQAEERIHNAEAAKNASVAQLQEIQSLYQEKLTAKQEASASYMEALTALDASTAKVAAAQAVVDAGNQDLRDAEQKITAVCQIEDCEPECVPGIACSPCINSIEYDVWDYCQRVESEDKINYRTELVTETRCVHQRQCRIVTRVRGWATTVFGQTCSYVCLPEEETFERDETYYNSTLISHTNSCSTSGILSVDQTCCQENLCSQLIQDVRCIHANRKCDIARQPAYDNLNEIEKALLVPVQTLRDAEINHTLVLLDVAMKETAKNLTEQEFQLIQPTYLALTQAVATSETNYQRVLSEEQPYLNLKSILSSNTIQDLIQIDKLSFSIKILESSPSVIPLVASTRIPYLNRAVNFTIDADLSGTDEIVKRHLSDQLIEHVSNELSNSGKKKRSVEQVSLNVQRFEQNCVKLTNLINYLSIVNNSLDSVIEHIKMAKQNTSNVIRKLLALQNITGNSSNINFQLLLDQFLYNVTDEALSAQALNSTEVMQILSTLQSVMALTQGIHNTIGETAFYAWQQSMGDVTIAGSGCLGFVDCLTSVGSLTLELLQDTPGAVATEMLNVLPEAKQSLLQVGLATNLSLTETKEYTAQMFTVLTRLNNIGYWCSIPPVITTQPNDQVKVDIGQDFSINCVANSSLPVAYSWKKDSFVLPLQTMTPLTKFNAQPIDEGVYQCIATNPIASTPSLYSNVKVYEPVIITLSPNDFTTFEGDDNGAEFTCNATGRPQPLYEWYWRTEEGNWSLVANSSTNSLFLAKPLTHQEGWYRCRAYTGNGAAYSGAARLTILPVSISKLVIPITFELTVYKTLETSGSGSSGQAASASELIMQSIISTIETYLKLSTSRVGNINVTLSQSGNVTVTLDLFAEAIFPLNETLADIAILARYNRDNILQTDLNSLQLFLRNDKLDFIAGETIYHIIAGTIDIEDLRYICPIGHELQYNNFLCVGCPPGLYQKTVLGEHVCSECGKGYYQTQDASTSCNACPSGYTTITNNSRTRDDCLSWCKPGYYNSSYGVEPCTPCPVRYYQLNSGATSCIACGSRTDIRPCFRPSTSATAIPTTTPTVERPGDSVTVIAVSVSSGVITGLVVLLLIVIVIFVIRRHRHTKSMNDSPAGFDNLYAETRGIPNQGTIQNPYRPDQFRNKGNMQDEIWRANPLYMDTEELEAEDMDYYDQLTANNMPSDTSLEKAALELEEDELRQEETVDVPISFDDEFDNENDYDEVDDDDRTLI